MFGEFLNFISEFVGLPVLSLLLVIIIVILIFKD